MPNKTRTPEQTLLRKQKAIERILAWRKKNPDLYKEANRRISRKQNLARYGLTEDSFQSMLLKQGNVCACCKGPNKTKRNWHVDHCHKTGKVRGILCHHCNLMIGHAKDMISNLQAGIRYLNG